MTLYIRLTTASHIEVKGPFRNLAEAANVLRSEPDYYRGRLALVVDADSREDARRAGWEDGWTAIADHSGDAY